MLVFAVLWVTFWNLNVTSNFHFCYYALHSLTVWYTNVNELFTNLLTPARNRAWNSRNVRVVLMVSDWPRRQEPLYSSFIMCILWWDQLKFAHVGLMTSKWAIVRAIEYCTIGFNLCFKTCQQILFILNLFIHSVVIFNLKTKSVVKVPIFVWQAYKDVVGS